MVSVHPTLGNSSVQAGTREGRRLRVDRKIAGHAMPHFRRAGGVMWGENEPLGNGARCFWRDVVESLMRRPQL